MTNDERRTGSDERGATNGERGTTNVNGERRVTSDE
jgi:hypothetical protein